MSNDQQKSLLRITTEAKSLFLNGDLDAQKFDMLLAKARSVMESDPHQTERLESLFAMAPAEWILKNRTELLTQDDLAK